MHMQPAIAHIPLHVYEKLFICHDDIEMLTTLLALCDGKPPVGFPSQRASYAETVELQVILLHELHGI